MLLEDQLNICKQNIWLSGQFASTKVNFTIYDLQQNKAPVFKLQAAIDLKNDCSPIVVFGSGKELHQFMQNPNNYQLNYLNRTLTLRWQINAQQYNKKINFQLKLKQQPLSKVDKLRCENYSLKKKLFEYQQIGKFTPQTTFKQQRIVQENHYYNPSLLKAELSVHQAGTQIMKRSIQPQIQKAIDYGQKQKNDQQIQAKKKSRRRRNDSQEGKLRGNQRKSGMKTKLISKAEKSRKNHQKIEKSQIDQPINLLSINSKMDPESMKAISIGSQNSEILVDKHQVKYKRTIFHQKQKQQKDVPRKVRLQFENGDSYFGQAIDDVYNGYGIYTSKSGSFYEGYWKNGKAEGRGTSVDLNGNKYQGQFKSDRRHGNGLEIYQNGQKYEGQFKDDFKNGYGRYQYLNGDYYEGLWKKNMCEGKGKEVYADGNTYQGVWVRDQKHGQGILTKPNGQILRQYFNMGQLIKEYVDKGQKMNQDQWGLDLSI